MTKFPSFPREEGTQEFKKGSVIFEEGDPGDVMFVVIDGIVEIKSKGATVNQVGADEILGELALIDNAPRSASAYALTDCKLAIVDRKRFESLIQ